MKQYCVLALIALLLLPGAFAQPLIVVDPVRDVLPGDAVYYPVTVTNTDDDPISVTLGLEGVNLWGFFRVDPKPTQIIAGNDAELFYVYLSVHDTASTGTKDFVITATTDGGEQVQAPLRIAILREVQNSSTNSLPWIILGILMIIAAIVAIIIASRHEREDEPAEGGEDDDFITFY